MNVAGQSNEDRWTRLQVLKSGAAAMAGGVLAAAAAACGSGGSQGGSAPGGAAKAPVQLQMLSQVEEAFPDLLRQVNQRLPHVTVELMVATGNAFLEKGLALGVGGTPPDFSYSNARYLPALVDAGLLLDVNTIVKRDKIDLGGVVKPVLEDLSWRGQLGALVLDIGYGFVRYNKVLFERAGQPDPGKLWQDKKWNWDTFVTAAIALSRTPPGEQEQVGFVVRSWEGDYLTILRTLGGDVLSKDRTKFVLDDGPGVAALGRWAELVTRHKASPAPDRLPAGGFNGGRVAMLASHPGEIKPTRKALGDAGAAWGWDVVPHPAPAGKKAIATLFSNGIHLWKGSKQEATMTEVVKLLTSPEMMLEWGALTGREPGRSTLIADYAKRLDIPALDPKTYVKVSQELAPDVRGLPLTPHYVEWHTLFLQQVLLPVGRGEKGPQDAARGAAPAINAVLARPK